MFLVIVIWVVGVCIYRELQVLCVTFLMALKM